MRQIDIVLGRLYDANIVHRANVIKRYLNGNHQTDIMWLRIKMGLKKKVNRDFLQNFQFFLKNCFALLAFILRKYFFYVTQLKIHFI